MLNGIETVVYYVDDIKAATAWYKGTLGIEPNYDTPYYSGFTVAGDEFGLHPSGEADAQKPGVRGQITYWSVTDIKATVAHFIEHGAKPHAPPNEVGGGIIVASVLDPFGNAIGFIQNPHSPNKR
jgi:predicted enzyme related to lactoylglutathione lyase